MRHRTTALLAAAALIGGLVLTTATATTASAATTTPRPVSTQTSAGGFQPADDDCDVANPDCDDCDDGLLGCILDFDGGLDIGIHLG